MGSDASGLHTNHGRSVSPGQYAPRGLAVRQMPNTARSSSHGHKGPMPLSAWPEGVTSPRTPRQHGHASGEYRMNAMIAELQRQAEAERRSMQRQMEHLERRQEQLSAPAAGRERWADLQGSVSGLLEEMSSLSRRVESLDEKLRSRIGGCEELTRQKVRELEQQLHAQQQKTSLAVSTSEEMSKRHSARIRKLGQSIEEVTRRLAALDEAGTIRQTGATVDAMQIEARLSELEGQQASLEEEFRNLAAVQDGATQAAMFSGDGTLRSSADSACGGLSVSCRGRDLAANCEGDFDSALRTFERDLARTCATLDEHAAALANLRVRSDGQEQRLAATYERLETVVASPLEAFRTEVLQMRDNDRQEFDKQLGHWSRRLQAVADASDEATTELRDGLAKTKEMVQVPGPRFEDNTAIRKLMDTSMLQEQALRRLEAMVREPHRGAGSMTEELCEIAVRMDSVEHRMACLEQTNCSEELSDKADRAEILRLDASLQELSEPLRRLSQRTASSEARASALERQVERLQQHQEATVSEGGTSSTALLSARCTGEEISALISTANARAESLAKDLVDVRARLVDLESQLEGLALGEGAISSAAVSPQGRGGRPAAPSLVDARVVGELSDRMTSLMARVDRCEQGLEDEIGRAGAQDQHVAEALTALDARLNTTDARHEELSAATLYGGAKDSHDNCNEGEARVLDLVDRISMDEVANKAAHQRLHQHFEELQLIVTNLTSSSTAQHDDVQEQLQKVGAKQEEIAQRVESHEVRIAEELRSIQLHDGAASELQQQLQRQVEILNKWHEEQANGKDDAASDHSDWTAEITEALRRIDQGEEIAMQHRSKTEERLTKLDDRLDTFADSIQRSEASDSLARIQRLEAQHGELAVAVQDNSSQKSDVSDVVLQIQRLEDRHNDLVETVNNGMCHKSEISDTCNRIQSLEVRHGDLADVLQKQADRVNEISEVAARVKSLEDRHEEAMEAVQDSRSHGCRISTALDRMQSLEQQTKDLETRWSQQLADFAPMRESRDVAVQERISEVLVAVQSGETATSRLQEEIRQEVLGIREEVMRQMVDESGKASSTVEVSRRLELHEAAFEQLRAQVVDQPARIEASDQLVATSQRVAKAETALADLQKDLNNTIRSLESRLDKLRIDHELLAKAATPMQPEGQMIAPQDDGSREELAGRVAEALRRAKVAEEAVVPLRAELQEDRDGMRELATQVREAVERVEASEAATMAVREELMNATTAAATPAGGRSAILAVASADAAERVEERVRQLQEQIAGELEALQAHQLDLAKAYHLRPESASAQVESIVEEFARQVEAELNDLREHQSTLAEFKAKVERLGASNTDGSNGNSATGRLPGPAPLHVEAKISELFEQVTAELSALTAQQHELGQAKTTLQDIAGQMKDVRSIVALCQNATGDLREFVQGQGHDVNVATGGHVAVGHSREGLAGCASAGGRSVGANNGAPSRGGRGSNGATKNSSMGASDESDSYGDEEFEASAGLEDSA